MSPSDQHPVSDADARRLAKQLVLLFRSPLRIIGTIGLEKPLTIADTILIGGTLLSGLNVATGDSWLKEKNREFILKISECVYKPEEMEEFLFQRIREREEKPGEITGALSQIEELLSGPGAVRRLLNRMVKETIPKAPLGRPTAFNPSTDPDRFLRLSTGLNRICSVFLTLRDQFPKKSSRELLDFAKSEDPKAVDLARKHQKFISATLSDLDFRTLKTPETKARRLADAIAGRELFGWAFKYSVQKGGEFRRIKGTRAEE